MTTKCPFHDMDPSEVVWVQIDGQASLPYTAARLCDDWHWAKAMEPICEKAMAAIADVADRLLAG